MATTTLPEEIIMIILVRLPVESLVRFSCVCKSWCSLIKDSYFIRKHLNHVNSLENEYESAILFTLDTTFFKSVGIYKKDQEEGNKNTPIVSIKDVNFPVKPYNANIRASCDGILCITLDRDCVLLWNPSIKEYKRLSSPNQNSMFVYGIGYDPSTDDYKVVRTPSELSFQSLVEVFALKSNSWKKIQDNFAYKIRNCALPTFNNGCIHWVARRSITEETVIVYFDVGAEKFGELPLPQSERTIRNIELLLFSGNLRLAQSHYGGQVDLWVMKVYGVRESWTKLLTIPQLQGLGKFYGPLMPFCFTKTGIVLLRQGTHEFVVYNMREETLNNFFVDIPLGLCGITPYVESLVSPTRSSRIENLR